MQLKTITSLLTLTFTLAWQAGAQIYDTNGVVVQTFAGSGFSGYVDGQGTQTMFYDPNAVVADSLGNLFVWDRYNFRVRKITSDGRVSTFAGPPDVGGSSIAIDHSNALWVVGSQYPMYALTSVIRIGSDAHVSSTNISTSFTVGGVCVDSANNLYVSASDNRIYRYRTNAVLEVFVGSGNLGSADGNGIFTSFNGPMALTADAADNIYLWDSGNYLIRRITQNRDVVTIAGSRYGSSDGMGGNALFGSVSSMCVDDAGNLLLACGNSVRKMTASTNVTTLAGSFSQSGYANGAGNLARFNGASGICASQGSIFVADTVNQRIRQITFNPTPQPVAPANLQLSTLAGLQLVGTVGRTYQIQTSPDMVVWSTAATLLLTSTPYLWIDQHPVGGNKFYRAFLLP